MLMTLAQSSALSYRAEVDDDTKKNVLRKSKLKNMSKCTIQIEKFEEFVMKYNVSDCYL